MHVQLYNYIEDSCVIEFIKRVGQKLFRNECNKSNNTRAQMVDSIYHMTLRLLWNLFSGVKK